MRGTITDLLENTRVVEEKRAAIVETVQFGPYGIGQEFELELSEGGSKEAIHPSDMVSEIRELLEETDELYRLYSNRTEWAQELVNRFPDSYKSWRNLSSNLLSGGDLVQARVAIHKALELAPDEPSVKALLGRILILEGKADEAISIYRDFAVGDANVAAKETIGVLLLAMGKAEEAIAEMKEALEQKKNRPSIHYNLGVAHIVKGKCGRAISYFRKALQLDENMNMAYGGIAIAHIILGQLTKAEKMFRIAVQIDPTHPMMKLNLGRVLVMQNKWEEATILLQGLVQDYPNYWKARKVLAETYFKTHRHKDAAAQFGRVLEVVRTGKYVMDLSDILNATGISLVLSGAREAGEKLLKESIDVSHRTNTVALMNLAYNYIYSNKLVKAADLIQELTETWPKDIKVQVLLATFKYFSQDYEPAMEVTRNILCEDPTNLDAASILACILDDVYEDHHSAERILIPLRDKHGKNNKFLNNLAYTLILQGKYGEAQQVLEKIYPEVGFFEPISTATRGLLHLKRGDVQEGTRLYNEAARIMPDENMKRLIQQKRDLEIGIWFLGQGRTDRARRLLKQAAAANVIDRIYTRKALALLEDQSTN